MASLADLLQQAQAELLGTTARLDAQVLLCHVLQCDRSVCYARPELSISAEDQASFQALVQRRAQGEPIAYLVGHKEFWSRSFLVNAHTLIPRPETELFIEWCLHSLPVDQPLKVLDLGTGSGAIAITLALECPNWQISAVELSEPALQLAKANAKRLGAEAIQWHQGDWFAPVEDQTFDLILSNPPYIDADDPYLNKGDVRFEPSTALIAEQQGLADLTRLIQQAKSHLTPGGRLLLEHGYDQSDALIALLVESGYKGITQLKDYAGLNRIVSAYLDS